MSLLTRRAFFRAAALGGATVPSAMQAASTPSPVGPLLIGTGGVVRDTTVRCAGVVMMGTGPTLVNTTVRVPWWQPWMLNFRITFNASVQGNRFIQEPAPFWARVFLGAER